MRSKSSLCQNRKCKTPWPEARTQAKQQHRKKNPTRFDSPKNTMNKNKTPWQDEETQKITRMRTRAQNVVGVQIENAKHHGLKHEHRQKLNATKKTQHVLTPQKHHQQKGKHHGRARKPRKTKRTRLRAQKLPNKRKTPWHAAPFPKKQVQKRSAAACPSRPAIGEQKAYAFRD